MSWKDSDAAYSLISILLHWSMAVLIIGLFALGLYMTSLDYYHPWYHTAPDIHRSIGVLVAILLVIRVTWRLLNKRPQSFGVLWEKKLSKLVHWLLYLLIVLLVISGYLISTADGKSVSVFGWFQVPAINSLVENQEDIAGVIHEILAYLMIGLVSMHAVASLKHHFIDKDPTLKRMLGQNHSRK